ncbi:MAG: hypothetical protein WA999_14470, partial [Spirulinaceae cyanobacterium]
MKINQQLVSLTILGLLLIIPTSGCWALGNRFQFHDDPDLMEEEISQFIPVGSSIDRAKRIMESNSFKCDYRENGTFVEARDDPNFPGGKYTTYRRIDYLYCDLSKIVGVLRERRWQAAIVHDENREVKMVIVSTGLTG